MRVTLADPLALIPGFEETRREQMARYPQTEPGWQPVHTVYVPADRFDATTITAWGGTALDMLRRYVRVKEVNRSSDTFSPISKALHERVTAKLDAEPVEDLRIDFEDGYGFRPGEEEDEHAVRAAEAVATMHVDGTLPRRWGLRVKSFADGDPGRSVRTLDVFLTGVVERAGQLPPGFVATFPKVLMRAYLGQFADCLKALEGGLGLEEGTLRFEMQVEAPRRSGSSTRTWSPGWAAGWPPRTSASSTTPRAAVCRRSSSGSTIPPATTPGTSCRRCSPEPGSSCPTARWPPLPSPTTGTPCRGCGSAT
ncbi:hypothetical protein AB0395_15145 [Streptosporangium sp. NPDC051023]|uniref:DUF6986 family protein n=1 Tax=Streptosporangium sp. NPDC051023 TaxID=3155410 RepID=UPI00344E904F